MTLIYIQFRKNKQVHNLYSYKSIMIASMKTLNMPNFWETCIKFINICIQNAWIFFSQMKMPKCSYKIFFY